MACTREVPDKGRIGGDLLFLPLFQPARVEEYNGRRAKYRLDLYCDGSRATISHGKLYDHTFWEPTVIFRLVLVPADLSWGEVDQLSGEMQKDSCNSRRVAELARECNYTLPNSFACLVRTVGGARRRSSGGRYQRLRGEY